MEHAAALLERYPSDPRSARVQLAVVRRVTVPDGALTAYVMPAAQPSRGLPILYIPGWGGTLEGFLGVVRAIGPEVDLYYLETREKRSSDLTPGADFSMRRVAADVGAAAEQLGLSSGRYLLLGSSYGGAVAVQALADRTVQPALTLLYDPMPRLWMPRLIMRTVAPLLSPGALAFLRPALKRLVLAGMREPTQRRRAELFIDAADMAKWRAAALNLRDWDLFRIAPAIDAPVEVINGCADRFHKPSHYPEIAKAVPGARYVRIPVAESQREHLMGAVATAYALAAADVRDSRPGLPDGFERFVAG